MQAQALALGGEPVLRLSKCCHYLFSLLSTGELKNRRIAKIPL